VDDLQCEAIAPSSGFNFIHLFTFHFDVERQLDLVSSQGTFAITNRITGEEFTPFTTRAKVPPRDATSSGPDEGEPS